MADTPNASVPSPQSSPQTGLRKRWRFFSVAFVVVLLLGGGAILRSYLRTPPEPPVFPVQEGADPAVVDVVMKARQAVLADRKNAAAWGELGMVFGAHGYEPEADRCFVVAEELDSSEPRWPYYRGLFARVHHPDEAINHFRRTLATVNPSNAEAISAVRLRLAETLLEQQQIGEAEALFQKELAKWPDNPRARWGLAHIALIRGDHAAARASFQTLVGNPFARRRAASQAAALARADGDLTDALQNEEIARQGGNDPDWPDPYLQQLRKHEVGQRGLLQQVEALEAGGQLREATDLLLEMVQTDPKPRLLVTAGIYLAKLRDYSRAERMLRECLRKEPENAQANYFLTVVLFEQAAQLEPNRANDARTMLLDAVKAGRAAVAAKPDHGLAWLYLGRSLLGVGESAEAVLALRQAVACRPEILDTHLYLAESLAASGNHTEAIRSAQNAEKLARPGDTRPRQLLDRLQSQVTPKK